MARHSDSDIRALVKNMTLKEKCSLLSGEDFWHTKTVERLGIPAIMVSDGPHGLRKQDLSHAGGSENDSIKAVCFPAACATASSFDPDVMKKLGETLGDECQAEDVSTILGPAINIKRSPLCGRNFEYMSEDPYLAGELASSYIDGVQSKGVGVSLKHFALNSQEYRRLTCSSNCDERTMREIYLPAFETAVKKSQPKTIMHSYNLINGTYSGESSWLLRKVLRKEWGFKGVVMSDWGAVNSRVAGVKAGCDLEMPGHGDVNDKKVLKAARKDKKLVKRIDESCFRILRWVYDFEDGRKEGSFDFEKHHEIARLLEEESIVLLKNSGMLPLGGNEKFALIGEFAKKPRYQGGGSSHINAIEVTSAYDTFHKAGLEFDYEQGYIIEEKEDDKAKSSGLLRAAVEAGKKYGRAVVFAGLPDSFESEGYDRKHLDMPANQNTLIDALADAGVKVTVVMHNGSPVVMPWRDKVDAIVEAYLGGEAVGEAVVNVLTGKVNPSGKLAETFPLRLEDTPSFLSFANDKHNCEYTEGIYVGYRWYDTRKMDVEYPFGFGLSYTTFDYSNLELNSDSLGDGKKDKQTVTAKITVKNTGKVAGKEVVQLYISDKTGLATRPEKELKGFKKVFLKPGESVRISFTLDKRSFAYYSTELEDWYAPSGTYELQIGSSSRDIRATAPVVFKSKQSLPVEIGPNTTIGDLLDNKKTRKVIKTFLSKVMEKRSDRDAAREAITDEMIEQSMDSTPLRGLYMAGMHVKKRVFRRLVEDLLEKD
ncbi:MAG: glycoside hydrolase family 3 C-terminal domain-containing protein [Treponema sp.]|nr:glycoside hydrolase family 3 C-terminal domain-containing protein [Treponema sp.]